MNQQQIAGEFIGVIASASIGYYGTWMLQRAYYVSLKKGVGVYRYTREEEPSKFWVMVACAFGVAAMILVSVFRIAISR